MKVEILEISPRELFGMLDTQNPVELCELLIRTLAMAVKKITIEQLKKEVANELLDYCEDCVFLADKVIDSINDAKFLATIPEISDADYLADLADYQADEAIKRIKEND